MTGIRYEWSPGRRDPRYLGNGTAFDVYLEYTAADGSPRFLGVEVKYHEDLGVKAPSCEGRSDHYRTHLVDQAAFHTTTLEDVVTALAAEFDEPWVNEFRNRYLDVSVIDRLEAADS